MAIRPAPCHPESELHCKNLCRPCYNKQAHSRRMLDPEFRARSVAKSRKWALDNPERAYLLDANKHLQRRFGITMAQYNSMLQEQNGVCAICKNPEKMVTKKRVSRLAVDHCHATGRIRGLLCFKCNTSIALVETNISLLDTIKIYIGDKNVSR